MNPYRNHRANAEIEALARSLQARRLFRLRLRKGCADTLRRRLAQAEVIPGGGDDLRRLKAESARINARLRDVQGERGSLLSGCGNDPRVLLLARVMLAGGETRLDAEKIMGDTSAFDGVQHLTMRELQNLPLALRIALCEALAALAEEILAAARARQKAAEWVRRGGRLRGGKGCMFWAHALKLCSEQELPELHARAEKIIERSNTRPDRIVEQAHRMTADHCLRLNNLLLASDLLQELDWEPCFALLSAADQELCRDPAQVYPRMDEASMACIREAVGELARDLDVPEAAVAGYALRLACASARERGAQDPRSTVCWYLYEDAGRAELCREMGSVQRLRRRIPDAGGRKTAMLVSLACAAVLAILLWAVGKPLLMIFMPPLAWESCMQLIGAVYPRYVRPGRILKMKIDSVPDSARTLVVLPVLLSSAQRAEEMLAHMESLGCLEQDKNIDFLLLGDFRDADSKALPEDAAICTVTRQGVEALNREAGRSKYFYLHRSRSLRARDERWMGENRKRGALMALNALLLNRHGAQAAFDAEGGDAQLLAGRYRYVVTLDADTEYLPGTLQQLIGAMLHPLNRACAPCGVRRGYAVLQPAMLLMAEACTNAYVRLNCGSGGMDSYPVTLSEFYQDVTGRGCFAGKGIYEVRAFTLATENRLPDDAILSHDLIEGILSGAGSLGDVCFYDGCPEDLSAELIRLHRWTRGDWQLLPVLFSRMSISAIDRMKLLGNLLRSLHAPALLGLLIHSLWLDEPVAFGVGLLIAFRDAILHPGAGLWKRGLFRLTVLPAYAACSLDAVLRTLWRLLVSRRHLMDWLPAADAQASRKDVKLPGRVAALLLLPGLLRPSWIPAVIALAALFWLGGGWAEDLARTECCQRPALSGEQAALLQDLAGRTWRFFESYVPLSGCGLPPDNVQLDPPAGAAMRTSPTNIGLYMMSCLAACRMGLIRREEMLSRLSDTVSTLEKLEKWNGHIYNWYDLNSLKPLSPRYVSAVDSGNLAGALLLCAHELKGEELGMRILDLACGMNLAALYDERRKLFFIGMDADGGSMSRAHYDLYASEARILSYAAMMLGQVPVDHWRRLGRASVCTGRQRPLLSWSGTMFEYLMPELLLRSPDNTLAGQNRRAVVDCQIAHGRAMNRPWGVSESGHYAFDLHLNYQYRAFGLRALALSPHAVQDVAAPYAAALALMVRPCAATDNLREMCDLGWSGELGLYEAADYQDTGNRPRIVRSHMAHHQGMVLCAICNTLCDDALSRSFMEIPQARALRLLLQEKSVKAARGGRRPAAAAVPAQSRPDTAFLRRGRCEGCAADTHLLHGGGTTALVTARGAVYAWKDGWQLNRFFGDLTDRHQGMYVHLRETENGTCAVIGDNARVDFDAGYARFRQSFAGLQAELCVVVSPEDGTVYQQLTLHNPEKEAREVQVTGCLAVALAPEKDMRAHPVFQNLFVHSRVSGDGALLFRRRRREPGEAYPELAYLLSGAEVQEYETSLEALVGRTGSLGGAGGIAAQLDCTDGYVLNPCAAIRSRVSVEPGAHIHLYFALALVSEKETDAVLNSIRDAGAPERALQLASTQIRAMLSHAGVDAQAFRLLQRSAALVFDPRVRREAMQNTAAHLPAGRNVLWQAGISGDLPILLVEIGDPSGLDCVRDVIRMHAFYRMMGVKMDFVLIDCHGSDYLQPARGALSDLIASSHLNGTFGAAGGAFVLEKRHLPPESYEAIHRAAALRFDAAADSLAQLRDQMEGLHLRDGRPMKPMRPETAPEPGDLAFFNGYGGFEGGGYVISLRRDLLPPAPWSNVLAGETAGAIVTGRGGGYAWKGNSRSDRLTPFANDPLREGWGWMFYLVDEGRNSWLRLLPGDVPMVDFTVRHAPGISSWSAAAEGLAFSVELYAQENGLHFAVNIRNGGNALRHLKLAGLVNWLMGTDGADDALLRCWNRFGACFASGTAKGVGVFTADDPRVQAGCDWRSLLGSGDMMNPQGLDMLDNPQGGWTLRLPLSLRPGEERTCRFLLGSAGDINAAYALARDFRSGGALRRSGDNWNERLEQLRIFTPDPALNLLAGGFLQAQALNARIRGRTGLYQGGGAFGFRDQLQDMLPMIHYEPERVRRHLLHCAARQFEAGDVLHWWHEPYTGVRTHISDDLLFLPYVAAQYVRITGDAAVLQEQAPFLKEIAIPEGREDVYAEMQPTAHCASLHRHCMLALRRAADTGEHGLCRMGSGDWNDGMNRVGAQGRGESIWLTQFLAACARDYAEVIPEGDERSWLLALNKRLRSALEKHGWDGQWYLRAYADDGQKLGSTESTACRIDLISQGWSVLAGLDAGRSRSAVNAAWEQLADEELGLIRLLTPPFDGGNFDPGYIAAYPPGVRENGAQYTHAACWMLIALIRLGDGERAHRALQMLLPVNHALNREDADRYRVEPYVMAADVYAGDEHGGRGGWSWYTGSAAWMLMAILELLGYERRGRRVRMNALLHEWNEASIKLRFGLSSYTLVSRRDAQRVTVDGEAVKGDWITLADDGREHTAIFPARS